MPVIELLDKTSNQALRYVAALVTSRKLFAKGNLVKLLHVLALCQHLEERFLLENILQNESCVHDGLIFTLTAKLLNQGRKNELFLLCNLCGDVVLKV